jgi:hypothetical protein
VGELLVLDAADAGGGLVELASFVLTKHYGGNKANARS